MLVEQYKSQLIIGQILICFFIYDLQLLMLQSGFCFQLFDITIENMQWSPGVFFNKLQLILKNSFLQFIQPEYSVGEFWWF